MTMSENRPLPSAAAFMRPTSETACSRPSTGLAIFVLPQLRKTDALARHTRNRTRLENIELKARAAHCPFKQRRARRNANHHRLKKFKQRAISEKSASRLPIADIRQAAACFRDGVVPACAALIAATERSTADQSPLISPPAAESGATSPMLAPAASVSTNPVRWLTCPAQTGIPSGSKKERDCRTAGASFSSRFTGVALRTTA